MAVTGSFADIPLTEVLATISRRSGKLFIADNDSKQSYELHFMQGMLCAFFIGKEPVKDVSQIRDYLKALSRRGSCTFEFAKTEPTELVNNFLLPIERLGRSMASEDIKEQVERDRERFAHPDTRFILLKPTEFWAHEGLELFFQSALHLLSQPNGVSARELIQKLDLPISMEVAQLYLYQLRSHGAIAPVRAFESETQYVQSQQVVQQVVAKGGKGGIFGAFRNLFSRLFKARTSQ
ncbi:DUF4388 domain-containing protein [Deinococcus misasensis]|uniref:DUF4388 domain-containing protein n=1 Tax=Deinococcus misasensis TaxID=392413 RepID=UPI000557F112|nr:DUF4388 domain-containing protein [Deinococcus misasensis]